MQIHVRNREGQSLDQCFTPDPAADAAFFANTQMMAALIAGLRRLPPDLQANAYVQMGELTLYRPDNHGIHISAWDGSYRLATGGHPDETGWPSGEIASYTPSLEDALAFIHHALKAPRQQPAPALLAARYTPLEWAAEAVGDRAIAERIWRNTAIPESSRVPLAPMPPADIAPLRWYEQLERSGRPYERERAAVLRTFIHAMEAYGLSDGLEAEPHPAHMVIRRRNTQNGEICIEPTPQSYVTRCRIPQRAPLPTWAEVQHSTLAEALLYLLIVVKRRHGANT
ncbi:hypothetical protein F8S13_12215 [Chloroflexia bacterium SDU3-3]|nr:hypothetical protein F8S13_12215 [Chloroflexia bacterium SDU3-3]